MGYGKDKNKHKIFLLTFLACLFSLTQILFAEDVRFYNLDRSAKVNDIEEVIFEWLRDLRNSRGLNEFAQENKLILVAREYAKSLNFEKTIERREIKKLFWTNGVTEVQFFPYSVIASGSLKDVLIALKTGIIKSIYTVAADSEYNLAGTGMVENNNEYKASVLLVKRYADLDPFPKVVQSNDARILTLKLLSLYRDPRVYLTTPGGKVKNIDVEKASGTQYRSFITFPDDKGRYEIELLVSGKMGPVVANLFPVFLDSPINYDFLLAGQNGREHFNSTDEMERELFRLCNLERTKFSISELKYGSELAKLAKSHSDDMVKKDYFAHQGTNGETLAIRAKRMNIDYTKIGENIAKNKSINETHANLMQSPAHRENILDPLYTHVGIGVVKKINPDKSEIYYITQHFATLNEKLSSSQAKLQIYEGIKRIRNDNSLLTVRIDSDIEKVAEYFSNKMSERNIVGTNIDGENLLAKAKSEIPSLKILSGVVFKTRNLKQVYENKINLDNRFDKMGCGISQDEKGRDFWITLILAK